MVAQSPQVEILISSEPPTFDKDEETKWEKHEPSTSSGNNNNLNDEVDVAHIDDDEVVVAEKEMHVASVVLQDALVFLEEGLRMEKDQATSKSHAASDETTKGRLTFFSRACSTSLFLLLAGYAVAITLAGLLAHYGERHLGLVILALLPGVTMMTYLQRLFSRSVLRREMVLTFFMAILWMSPLVVVENGWYYGVLTASHLEKEAEGLHSSQAIDWAYRLLSAFVRAFLVAGFFEELAKYLALRRLRTLPYVTDPRALVTYGLCCGAAFGTVENLFIYAFSYGIDNTIARAFLSVPLHGMTGLLMGCSLAEDRFLRPGSQPWYKVIAVPLFIHGSFDFLTFLLSDNYTAVSIAVEVLLLISGFVIVRYGLVNLMRAMPVEDDIHATLKLVVATAAPGAGAEAVIAPAAAGTTTSSTNNDAAGVKASSAAIVGLGLQLPTTKRIILVAAAACVLLTGMLCFLYLWQY